VHASHASGSSWTRSSSTAAQGSSWTRSASDAGRGSSWTRSGSSWTRLSALLAAAVTVLVPTSGAAFAATPAPAQVSEAPVVHVVRAAPGALAQAEAAVVRAGGSVLRRMSALQTLSVRLPASAAARLAQDPAVASVVRDRSVALAATTYDAVADPDSLYNVRNVTGATPAWSSATGAGVDVALIDSGVSNVPGLDASRVLHGPDLSFESQNPDLRNKDTYGHGTHMAGIILGRDEGAQLNKADATSFLGMAPNARLVSLKVADAHGNSDVTQVLAAIDWVVQHKSDPGLNVKVLNLSFGTDSSQAYGLDPLAQAVEVAWANGITVVTSAGNSGSATGRLTMPAVDPYVIAVGAADSKGTKQVGDDVIPAFSSRGDGVRNPDLVAPGRSVQSLRVPGSYVDLTYGAAGKIDERYFRGSGTSQAAAAVSGAAALLISRNPALTPDQVKWILTSTANKLPAADPQAQGAGMLDLRQAIGTSPIGAPVQRHLASTGAGSIDASRGSAKLVLDGVTLQGERDIFNAPYVSASLAAKRALGTAWTDGTYNGSVWTGSSWAGSSWAGSSWAGSSWAGSSWAGSSWATGVWTGSSWAGSSWAGSSWAGSSWAGSSWAGSSWAGSSWASGSWS